MKVKVHCPCGSKFEFEVEPANGRMPVRINCPTCGTEATELANAVIQQQMTDASKPAPVRVAVKAHSTTPAPPAPPPAKPAAPSGLRIAKSGPAVAVYEGPADLPEAGIEPCHRHPSEPAVDHCAVCGKAICEKCRQQFGHVCSIFCREAATHHNVEVPVYTGQRGQTDARAERRVKLIAISVGAVLALVLGTLAWYTWIARDPKVVYSAALSGSAPFYELIAPGQLFSVKDGQAALLDVTKNASIWSVSVPADFMVASENFRCLATTNDLWLVAQSTVLRLDRQTGARKDLALPDNILEIVTSADSLLLISHKSAGTNQLTRVSLADGSTQAEDASSTPGSALPARGSRPPPGQRASPAPQGTTDRLRGLATAQTRDEPPAPPKPVAPPQPLQQQYLGAGPNAVQFTAQLLEYKTVVHEAMKQRGKSVLDNNNVTASQGIDLAEEMMNDSKREETGGVDIEDVSRYRVTLHRLLRERRPRLVRRSNRPAALDPSQVCGPPRRRNTNLYVFDQKQQEIMGSPPGLSPARPRLGFYPDSFPRLETSDALYFADQGVLARFDLFTGNVSLASDQCRHIGNADGRPRQSLRGFHHCFYAESIRFSQQVSLRNRARTRHHARGPGTGKSALEFATLTAPATVPCLPGKFLFSTREWQEQDSAAHGGWPRQQFQHQAAPCSPPAIPSGLIPSPRKTLVKAEVPAKLDPAPIHRRRPRPEVLLALTDRGPRCGTHPLMGNTSHS